MKPSSQRIGWAALLAASLFATAACGLADGPDGAVATPSVSVSPPTGDPGGTGFNDTDVMFAQMMVPHHRQGIEMAEIGASRATSNDVKLLAAAIVATQNAEERSMSGWLRRWGKPATAPADAHAGHGGMPKTDEKVIAGLKPLTGAAFDRTFLNLLIAHQDDALQIARMESGSGANAEAKALAKRIELSRAAQITQMLTLLGEKPRT